MLQFVLIIAAFLLPPIDDVRLKTASGTELTGPLVRLDRTAVKIGNNELAIDQVTHLTFTRAVQKWDREGAECFLVDGSRLRLKSWTISEQMLELTTQCGQRIRTPTHNVRAIKTRSQASGQAAAWQELSLAKPKSGDAIIIERSGHLETLEGRVGDVLNDRLSFALDEQQAQIGLEKIEGIVFYHAAGRDLMAPLCQVTLLDGSTLNLRDVLFEEGRLKSETVSGVEFTLPVALIQRLDFGLDRVVFLSDTEPSSTHWSPLIASSKIVSQLVKINLPRTNQTFDGKPLSLLVHPDPQSSTKRRRREFANGFAIKSGSKIAFTIDKQYQTLRGLVGFDPAASASGNVALIIRGDGKKLLEQVLSNDRSAAPLDLAVDIKDISRLVIEIGAHDGRSVGDVLHFCDLRVVK